MAQTLYFLRKLLLALGTVLLVWWLVPRYGTSRVAIVAAILSVAMVCLAAWMLKTSTVGEITWKNRVAGKLAPWGWALSGGTLAGGAIASFLGWMALTGVGLLIERHVGSDWHALVVPMLTLACSFVYLHFIGQMMAGTVRYRPLDLQVNWRQLKLASILTAIVGASGMSFILGHAWLALMIVGVPLAIAGCGMLCFLLILIPNRGRIRWN